LKIDYDPTNTFNWSLTLGIINFSTVPFAFSANSLTGVVTTGASNGDVLKYNSAAGQWQPGTDNAGTAIPVGTILPFAGGTVPSGWMLCDGSAISRTTYSTLFAIIGNAWGAGDNTTTFNVPDMRGVFMRGVDGSAGNDPSASIRTALHPGGNTGNNVGSFQGLATKLPTSGFTISSNGSHTHTASCSIGGTHSHTYSDYYGNGYVSANYPDGTDGTLSDASRTTASAGSHSHAITVDADGIHNHTLSGGDNETRPKNVYVNYIIKY
jgi:microcystin-dependent protein